MTCIDNSLTRGNKAEIVGWGIPDYNSAVDISASVPTNTSGSYIVPFNGIIILNNQINGTFKGYLVNGIQVNAGTTYGSAWASFGNCQIAVKKGDIITVNETVSTKICYLIPFLGG